MNFYEYYQPGEALSEAAVTLAARELMAHGLGIIPLKKNSKEPANVKHVYDLISKPISEYNFGYFFNRDDIDLGMILDDDMEFIDVDEKNKAGITQAFLKAFQYGWQELYDKMVITFTASGGCHLLYRSEVTGGKQALAKRNSTHQPLVLIERINRSNKQYIKLPPSEGYTLYQRNPLDIQFITAEERNWVSALAMSFNELHIPEVKKTEAERDDSPWYVFNQRNDWKYIRNELIDRHWSVVMDLPEKVVVKRPGDSSQRSSGVIFKDSNVLYLYTTSTEFPDGKGHSPFGIYAMFYHDNNIASACKQLASEGCGKNTFDEGQFWKRNKSKIEIKYTDLLNWFHSIGYRYYNKTLVQIINNIVTIADDSMMKRAFLNEVEFDMQDIMYERVSTIFADGGGLMSMIDELPDKFITDQPGYTWLFFQNLAIKIHPDKIEPFEYKNLDGFIWQSDIIPRSFYECDFKDCDADRFVSILGGNKKKDLQEIIGYTISRYKDALNPRAVVLMEDIDAEDEGESQGGSGKGLLFNFIKQFRKSADFDGKNFRPQDPFLYQNIEPDTSVIFIDDVDRHFKFNTLFSVLTGSLSINKKNRPQIIIPFERSPKIFITSNFSVGSMDTSSIRRKYEFAITKYFGTNKEPIDEFGRQFFSGWDKHEWLRFDNFIASCCIMYLAETRKKDIGNITVNSSERSLQSNTNKEFVEYMDGQLQCNFFDFAHESLKNKRAQINGITVGNAVNIEMYLFKKDDPDYYLVITKEQFFERMFKIVKYKSLTITLLTRWLNRWSEMRNVTMNLSYKRGADSQRCYRILEWPYNFYSQNTKIESGNEENKPGSGWEPSDKWE